MLEATDLSFWGKARPDPGAAVGYHPAAYHCLDVAAVLDEILRARPSTAARGAALLCLSEADARSLLVGLAGLHDVGKFAPAFQAKSPPHWPAVLGEYHERFAVRRPHTEDGLALWEQVLDRRLAPLLWPAGSAALGVLAPGVFGHHGRPVRVAGDPARSRFPVAAHDAAVRFAGAATSLLCAAPIAAPRPRDGATRVASFWVAGLMTVADWVGSRPEWFPYEPGDPGDLALARYWDVARMRAARAVRQAGLVPPRVAVARSFAELTQQAEPTPLQTWAASAELPAGPVLAIIEDVTGAGKTEAAQVIVHRLMAAGRATGAYWAMPTMATANAMYERQSDMLGALYDTSDSATQPSLVLAHGQQRLHAGFRATVLGTAGDDTNARRPDGGVDEPESRSACAAFLADDRRAALLADVGAGTVDQAILGVLPSKFNTVRLHGLAGKVIVLDEAHAYDAYVGVEVRELLRFHAALGGSAVVLSATLARAQREELVVAWQEGTGARRRTATLGDASGEHIIACEAYPLATLVGGGTEVVEAPVAAAPWSRRSVTVRLVSDEAAALAHVVGAARAGGAVAWVRNTVDDCLRAAAAVRAAGVDPLVFHARFAQGDRQQREQDVLAYFGKEANAGERRSRVVVATQVVEQSLDLDFDAMVSDVAPIDLLVQRAGRLWRHPARTAAGRHGLVCELVVLAPEPADDPPAGWLGGAFKGTAYVYRDPGVLWRTVRVLLHAGRIHTPDGLRDLVEAVYGSDEVPPSLLQGAQRAEGEEHGQAAAATYATLKPTDGYDASAHAWMSDLRVPTRLGDDDVTVRLARVRPDGGLESWCLSPDGVGWKGWALSEVRVRMYRVPLGSAPESRYADAVAQARATWGRFEQDLPVLPLTLEPGGTWTGVLCRPGKPAAQFNYTADEGLSFGGDA